MAGEAFGREEPGAVADSVFAADSGAADTTAGTSE
jgi:hypothetical protein